MNSSAGIQVERDGFIKTIRFDQVPKKNAISNQAAQLFKEAILESKEDDSRVLIVTGSGKDFCAGADLDPALLSGQAFDVSEFLRQTYNPLVLAMREMNKPIIAKVRGACVGVGWNFALACDMILASETARFSQIFTRIGLTSDGGGAYFLPARVGYHKAFELMATNAIISAQEAADLGLVNRLLPDEALDEAVAELARQLAEGPYLAIQHTKANLRTGLTQGLAAALESEAIHQGKNFQSKDFFEGVAAFLQKRPAQFKGE